MNYCDRNADYDVRLAVRRKLVYDILRNKLKSLAGNGENPLSFGPFSSSGKQIRTFILELNYMIYKH